MSFIYFFFLTLFIIVSILLCLVILIQESKSSGFGASFGGESGESLFGTSTPEVLKKATAYLSVAFFAGCILLSLWTGTLGRAQHNKYQSIESEVIEP